MSGTVEAIVQIPRTAMPTLRTCQSARTRNETACAIAARSFRAHTPSRLSACRSSGTHLPGQIGKARARLARGHIETGGLGVERGLPRKSRAYTLQIAVVGIVAMCPRPMFLELLAEGE